MFVVLPLLAIAVKVDWPHFWSLITSPSSRTALLLSLRTAAASTALCVALGVPMALVLARGGTRLVRSLRPLILVPLVLPPVVGGIALLYAFGRLGLLGHYLEAAGISVAFSTTAVVLAQTFVSLPFLVISLEARRAPRAPISRWWPRHWARDPPRSGGASPCRCCCPVSCPGRCWRSPARWVSSARR